MRPLVGYGLEPGAQRRANGYCRGRFFWQPGRSRQSNCRLRPFQHPGPAAGRLYKLWLTALCAGLDRKSVGSGKSVSVRVDLGGRRIIKKKKKTKQTDNKTKLKKNK